MSVRRSDARCNTGSRTGDRKGPGVRESNWPAPCAQSASRQRRVRLDGACPSRQGRCPAGQGTPARGHVGRYRKDNERCRRWHDDHPSPGRHLSGQGARSRQCRGTRLDRNAAQSSTLVQQRSIGAARRGCEVPLRARTADDLAPLAASDHHVRRDPRQCPGRDNHHAVEGPIAEFPRSCPGYAVHIGGSVEQSAKSQAPIIAVFPIMLFIMATLLMVQLQTFQRLFLVLLSRRLP